VESDRKFRGTVSALQQHNENIFFHPSMARSGPAPNHQALVQADISHLADTPMWIRGLKNWRYDRNGPKVKNWC